MHQLIYTSCRPGMSLNGSGGYTVRAASPGLDQTWLAYAPHLARFDVGSSSRSPAHARFAFHRRQGVSFLAHSIGAVDFESRPASFTHALIDSSGQLGPTEAIGTWGSPFWSRADKKGTSELPVLEALPGDGTLNWATVRRHLQEGHFYAMVEFLLTAWLRKKALPIVLVADADKVASAIWLITRCLSPSAVCDLSFATQDHDPLTAGGAVIGYGGAIDTLPAATLKDRAWFDLSTGKCSDNEPNSTVQFICREARAGNWGAVDAFATCCSDLHIDGVEDMDLLHSVMHESYVCTQKELARAQHRPILLRWLLQDERHARVAVEILADGPDTTQPPTNTLVGLFSETLELKQLLVNTAMAQAAAALASQDVPRAEKLVGLCAGIKGAPGASMLWRRAVEQVEIERLAIEVRITPAERLLALGEASAERSLITRLLDVPHEALPVVLRCPARASLRAEACRAALDRTDAMTQATIEALASQPEVMGRLLRIARDPTAIARAVAAREPHAVLEILNADRAARSQVDFDALVDHVLKTRTVGVQELAGAGFTRYWGLLLQSPELLTYCQHTR